MILGIRLLSNKDQSKGISGVSQMQKDVQDIIPKTIPIIATTSPSKEDKAIENHERDQPAAPKPNYNVHAFYYPWYGNPEFDDQYLHWNHPQMPHWNKNEAVKWPTGRHKPPDDIGSNYFPKLGPYSSRDPKVIDDHMQQLRTAGVGKQTTSLLHIILAALVFGVSYVSSCYFAGEFIGSPLLCVVFTPHSWLCIKPTS